RINVSSGVTRIFGHGQSPGSFTLTDPLDAVFLDDMRVMHGVTPIAPLDGARSAFRDVLVLTFREDDPAPQ
ncbi:MAG: 2OG-Fe dioxygenase family protein, partial [Alphaproteobacteria bacterium]|nr:2OG-Fe dioxygenase family protein [Alphaproteobacteria bacterium]